MADAGGEGKVIACQTEDEFYAQMAKAKEDGKLVIIDFMAIWCGGCETMAPVYEDCAKEYPAAVFLQVDIDKLKEVAKNYSFDKIPHFYFIRNGETLEHFATVNEDRLRDTIKKYYDAGAPASASA